MDLSLLEKSALFHGVPVADIRAALEETPHHVRQYEKGEVVFRLLESAERVGVVLRGRVEAQKSFPNGSQVNVSVRGPGALIGPAAAFAKNRRYPCDMVALEPVSLLLLWREDLLRLMQRDERVLENVTTEVASATYMLQQRVELLSYSGIAQKAAFWLLTQARQSGTNRVRIPGTMTDWALRMNVSRPSLYRELRRLEERAVLRCAPPFIEIRDAAALQALLSETRRG
ncbi:MAG: Crp/Fnr family transcriptional regulator [Oscillospiraceae bacterium]|nr:Crp/Fnr family transcriptional regulator [Oscillospiraceae bacterium]